MDRETDAYGRAMLAHREGREAFEIVERDDGYVGPGAEPGTYFAPYEDWPDRVQAALARLAPPDGRAASGASREGRAERAASGASRGRAAAPRTCESVLDVGCGAGRHALYLQGEGHDVLAVDASPGAVEVARDRGVERARVLAVEDVAALAGPFDAVLMLGNNFGLVGTAETAPGVLDDLAAVAAPDATLLAESVDPRRTDREAHLRYHDLNRERGRLPGALRIRMRFETAATDWFDYLLAAPDEMRAVAEPTPWTLADVVEGDPDEPGYVGVLEKG